MLTPDPPDRQPFVSIHLACYNEPPEMVMITLDSLAALDYANYEVLVIDNNTKDPAIWQPVQAYCEKLGKHFRFFHLGARLRLRGTQGLAGQPYRLFP